MEGNKGGQAPKLSLNGETGLDIALFGYAENNSFMNKKLSFELNDFDKEGNYMTLNYGSIANSRLFKDRLSIYRGNNENFK